MTVLPHVLAGALIGSYVQNSILAFVLGVASHPLIDFIPHWDLPVLSPNRKLRFAVWIFILIELVVACIVLFNLYRLANMSAFWAALGGVLWDLEYPIRILFKIKKGFHPYPGVLHNKTTFKKGVLAQAIVLLLSAYLLYRRLSAQ
ncbi:MAG: hypothetical protein A2782_02330 [Candidatus Blackburnbacteria bacterium RIFCSPHIGHO2_01_FULL_43_15b]|uniref:Uncharacterized protein n=1 Tax=Candidatus Blackburnbacteria bacterium RIFCSPHIGHO2_01_FULL_43_15b TaxID=1797513 RepID=A0A1G1V0G0_9BACT|nr:MAG: hypothetical protein A2782_02330 [Candidatus Blackburnbacteria bacterium RIFCSPHIGHO2_01_FULL_43_15b]